MGSWSLARFGLFLGLALGAAAQTVLLTPSTTVLSAAGGNVTFTATLTYTALPSTLGLTITLPTGWAYVSGTTVPGTSPAEPAIAPTAGRTEQLEWAFINPPASPVTFTFTASYPGTATSLQALTPSTVSRDGTGAPPAQATAPAYTLSPPSHIVTWNGAAGNWTDAAQWTPGTVPSNSGGIRYSATVAAGIAALDTAVTIDNLTFTGGTINGAGNLTLAGLGSTWSGGVFSGLGELIIAPGAKLAATGGSVHDFTGRTIRNQGAFVWTDQGTLQSGGGGAFVNSAGAKFIAATAGGGDHLMASTGTGSFTFTNVGSFEKTTATTTRIDAAFTNTGNIHVTAGTLRFAGLFSQNGGVLKIDTGATLSFDNALSFPTGTLHGGGTVVAHVTNGAFISPGDILGTLTINGNLTLLATSQLQFDIAGTAPGSQHDVLLVSGNAVLNGSFSFNLTSGAGNAIPETATLTLLSSSGLTGTFTNLPNGTRLNAASGLGSFVLNYTATGITLSGFQAIPEPSTWLLLLAGLGALAGTLRRRRR